LPEEVVVALTPVFPPCDRLMSTGLFDWYDPHVKSGTCIESERFATDHSLNGAIQFQKVRLPDNIPAPVTPAFLKKLWRLVSIDLIG
jgi:hypothetical protein